jgi:hypothetical protein
MDGVTLNDPGDTDTGANNLQNFPVLSLTQPVPGGTHVVGTLDSLPGTSFTLDFYANGAGDPSGYGEGQRWLGSIAVTTDAFGQVAFDTVLSGVSQVGETVTATATDPNGNTSEFSGTIVVIPPPTVALSGTVFDDLDNDGVMDSGDLGIGGVALDLYDQATGTVVATTITQADGAYLFPDVPVGIYSLVQAQPAGYLDGKESAGTFGGIVDNSQDCNTISGVQALIGGTIGSGYNFAEIQPSRIQGLVWEDFNDDGEVNYSEKAIEGVEVHLTGIDDRGQAVDLIMTTDSQGIFEFTDLRPGIYALAEVQPAGFLDGQDSLGTVNGLLSGSAAVNDQFSGIALPGPGSDGVNYNFGERPAPGGQAAPGQTAANGFWQNKHGQALIKALNGGPNSTQLGNWLAATFPHLYGVLAGPNNLTGKTNTQVADLYISLFKRTGKTSPGGPPKLDAQVMGLALAVYVTNQNLAGTTAAAYGFLVTEHGVGVATFDVGEANRDLFGLAPSQSTVMTVMDILLATDSQTHDGVLFDRDGNHQIDSTEKILRTRAHDVFSAINDLGGI